MNKKTTKSIFGNDAPKPGAAIEAYASDGSIYRIEPRRVVCPRNEIDALTAIKNSLAAAVPITPRGGGTGLAGGALGTGTIVDLSRLQQIENIDYEKKTVTCQPGIIYKDLNFALKKYGLFFPPDPSSGDSCQIGGMLANNSSGPRSIKYGLTSHYVETLTIVDARGELLELPRLPLDSPDCDHFLDAHPEYREILHLLTHNRDRILKDWPNVKKNSAGYNLLQVINDLDKGIYNIPALYIGSEGTLGVFLRATLRLLPLPGKPLSFRLFFGSLEDAGDAIEPLLASGPCALEIVDGSTLDLIGRDKYAIPPNAEAMLILEYDEEHGAKRKALADMATTLPLSQPPEEAADENQRSALWAARRAIVPILYRRHPTKRPFGFIEDASVPVARLTEFIGWIRRRLEREHLVFGLFGHIGDGNLHIRPLLDIHQQADLDLTRRLYDEVYDKIIALGGSSTAEHADGRLRAPVLKKVYGPEIYGVFEKIKSILDPNNLFNPDVILSHRTFTDDIDFHKLELTCAACGKCNGYCPAFEIFRTEDMSPRGWLRMLHSNKAVGGELLDAYQFCLNCKNCTTVCPAGVDIAGEILDYKAKYPHKTAGRVISLFNNKPLFSTLLKTAALANPIAGSKAGRAAAGLIGRVPFSMDSSVEPPLPAFRTLRDRHPEACSRTTGVALFHGCADNYFVSTTGDAVVDVLEHFGYPVALPEQDCCGLPMEVYGHRETLSDKARANIDSLSDFETIIFTCASCLHRLADYPDLFTAGSEYHNKAKQLQAKLSDASQFLLESDCDVSELRTGRPLRVSYHHPCHLRAAGLEKKPLELLQNIKGIEIVHPELAGRCCGQAGSFGFTHFQEGKAIFDRKREEYLDLNPDIVVSSCPSCIAKVRKELPKTIRVCHPLQIIDDLIQGRKFTP